MKNPMYPEQIDVLSTADLIDYAGKVGKQYAQLRADYEDNGTDTREEMLELGSHLAMVVRHLSDRNSKMVRFSPWDRVSDRH